MKSCSRETKTSRREHPRLHRLRALPESQPDYFRHQAAKQTRSTEFPSLLRDLNPILN